MVDNPGGPTTVAKLHSQHDEAVSRPRRRLVPALIAIGQFVRSTVLLPVWIFHRPRRATDEITVYSAHPSFFLWLLIATGFVSAWVVRHHPNLDVAMGWVYIWVLLYFLVTLLYDL